MSKIPESERDLEFLVNCKTYPAISTKYIETVCTGGVEADGSFVRLYPVQFRFLTEVEQYDRWDIIRVRAYKDTKDTRPESWHLSEGSVITKLRSLTTDKQKWDWMKKTVHPSTQAMEEKGLTNGCVEIIPTRLYWKPEDISLSPTQVTVLRQSNIFATDEDMKQLADRIPWQFRLELTEKNSGKTGDFKVLAWSWYQGLRRRMKTMTEAEALQATYDHIAQSIFNPARTVYGIFGTHSRFGNWMISALYHVPNDVLTSPEEDLF